MKNVLAFLAATMLTACGSQPQQASETRYIATNHTGVTYLYWAQDNALFRGECVDGAYVMSLCQKGVQAVAWNLFKSLLAPGALNYELVTLRVEDLVIFMVDFNSPTFEELKTDVARFDELFRQALALASPRP